MKTNVLKNNPNTLCNREMKIVSGGRCICPACKQCICCCTCICCICLNQIDSCTCWIDIDTDGNN